MIEGNLIDRFEMAATLSEGKSVLDVGGQHPQNHDASHPFAKSYNQIWERSSDYKIFDREDKPGVSYVGDLNQAEGRNLFQGTLEEYQPEVVLCMEIFEHLNYPCIIMDILSDYILRNHGTAFITIPNNGNWILNALHWHYDHNYAFFKSIAARFVQRSGLGRCGITMYPCMQRYKWYWWIAYLGSFCQPFNWGFRITAK